LVIAGFVVALALVTVGLTVTDFFVSNDSFTDVVVDVVALDVTTGLITIDDSGFPDISINFFAVSPKFGNLI